MKSVFEKAVQYLIAYLIKDKIFSYAIEVDKEEISADEFYTRIENSLNFKIDDAYDDLENI